MESFMGDLSACETMIMKVIWDAKEDIALQDLIRELADRYKKNYARTTVVTFVHKIVDKGFATTYRKGKAAYIHPEKSLADFSGYITATPVQRNRKPDACSYLLGVHFIFSQQSTYSKKIFIYCSFQLSHLCHTHYFISRTIRHPEPRTRTCGNRSSKGIPPDHRSSGDHEY